MAELGLTEVVTALRDELQQAIVARQDQGLSFDVKEITIELQVGVTKTVGAETAVKFWVLELGASGEYESQTVQTVSLTLDPIAAGGSRVKIASGSDVDPLGR